MLPPKLTSMSIGASRARSDGDADILKHLVAMLRRAAWQPDLRQLEIPFIGTVHVCRRRELPGLDGALRGGRYSTLLSCGRLLRKSVLFRHRNGLSLQAAFASRGGGCRSQKVAELVLVKAMLHDLLAV